MSLLAETLLPDAGNFGAMALADESWQEAASVFGLAAAALLTIVALLSALLTAVCMSDEQVGVRAGAIVMVPADAAADVSSYGATLPLSSLLITL